MNLTPINQPDTVIRWQGHELRLHGEGTLYWPAQRLLALADLHLGREGLLRSAGLAMPGATSAADLGRLDALIAHYRPSRLLILGDLLHSRSAAGRNDHWLDQLARLTDARGVTTLWLLGNHDRPLRLEVPTALRIENRICIDGLNFSHEPPEAITSTLPPHVCGHLHPVLRWRDRFDRWRLPCFQVDPDLLVLPAFSCLAGGLETPLTTERVLYPVAGGRVLAKAHKSRAQGLGLRAQ